MLLIKRAFDPKNLRLTLWKAFTMRKVLLLFPDMSSMTEFIILNKISHAEVNSNEGSLITYLEEAKIVKVCTEYGALLTPSIVDA